MSEFIEKIRRLDERYSRIKLENAVYHRKDESLDLNFLMPVHFDDGDAARLRDYVMGELPLTAAVVNIKKAVCDCDSIKKYVSDFISSEYVSLRGRVSPSDVTASREGETIHLSLNLENEVCRHLEKEDFFTALYGFLDGRFCESFTCVFKPKKDSDDFSSLEEEKVDYTRLEEIPPRYFKVTDVTKLYDGTTCNEAMYIQDALERTGPLVIAGRILSVREKETKNQTPFYIFEFSDGTGKMSGTVFPRGDTVINKIKKLDEGSEVIVRGIAEFSKEGYHRFTVKGMNYCLLPRNFVPEERKSRRVPESYLVVSPEPVEDRIQTDMFGHMNIPPCLMGKSFVVFDFETTGTAPREDRITEIGAVKMVNGKITEKFATMVNPERKIPEEVVELTGITDDMVKNAPKFGEIAADLYKFCSGSILVAHNITFDYSFLKNMSAPFSYIYTNSGIDTLSMSRALLPELPNHKLDTVCAHFGIEFEHHRAYNDAFATAEMFVELIKLNGRLPEFDM